MEEVNIQKSIKQINHSLTSEVGAIRGMHYQNPPYAETKIVRCISGEVFDVVIDLRKDSETFLQWHGEYLNPEKAVSEMRQKLMQVGLHFGDVQFTEESGEVSVPLIQYGGAFGKSADTPIDEFDDQPESGRSLNFVFERTSGGTHRILAKIM